MPTRVSCACVLVPAAGHDPAETSAMPTHKGLWPDHRDGIEDRWKPSIQLDEEQAISVAEVDLVLAATQPMMWCRHEAAAESINPGGSGGPRRARHLPQCRERLLRSARQGARASGP